METPIFQTEIESFITSTVESESILVVLISLLYKVNNFKELLLIKGQSSYIIKAVSNNI